MVIRSHKSKNRQYNGHKRPNKVVIRSHKSKNRQYNGHKRPDKVVIRSHISKNSNTMATTDRTKW